MSTTNLQLTDIDESQAGKAATSNDRAEEIDAKLTAQTSVTVTTANVTLTDNQHNRTAYFKFTGAMTGNRDVICKTRKGSWYLEHACTGGFTITFKTSGGTGVALANGQKKNVYCDGTNVVEVSSLTTSLDAAVITYTPSANSDWNSSADPGNTDDALNQLAARTKTLETATLDASIITYTPSTNADWNSSADPGNTDDALDQLADRLTALEGGTPGGSGEIGLVFSIHLTAETRWPGVSPAALLWPAANDALYYPINCKSDVVVDRIVVINSSTISGHVDVGLYDSAGNKLITTGSTSQTPVSAMQTFSFTPTTLPKGLNYIAMAMDNTTGRHEGMTIATGYLRGLGIKQQSSAFPLPATATFSPTTTNALYMIVAWAQSLP